jgi:hypothetical protein
MQQHVLDDRVGAFAVLYDLIEIATQRIGQFRQLPGLCLLLTGNRQSALEIPLRFGRIGFR